MTESNRSVPCLRLSRARARAREPRRVESGGRETKKKRGVLGGGEAEAEVHNRTVDAVPGGSLCMYVCTYICNRIQCRPGVGTSGKSKNFERILLLLSTFSFVSPPSPLTPVSVFSGRVSGGCRARTHARTHARPTHVRPNCFYISYKPVRLTDCPCKLPLRARGRGEGENKNEI